MTLVLGISSPDFVTICADKRLTVDGELYAERAVKLVSLQCQNARIAIGYSGLAEVDRVRTDEWLRDYLVNLGAASLKIQAVVQLLVHEATERFRPVFRQIAPQHRLTEFLIVGFLYGVGSIALKITNRIKERVDGKVHAGEEFHISWGKFKVPYFSSIGATDALPANYLSRIRQTRVDLSGTEGPVKAAELALVKVMKEAASHKSLGHLIGSNYMTLSFAPTGDVSAHQYGSGDDPLIQIAHIIQPGACFGSIEVWPGDEPPSWFSDRSQPKE